MTRIPPVPVLLAATLACGFLTCCTRQEDPGIKEKIALLEAELRDRDAQLTELHEQASSETAPASPAARAPDLDKARSGYLAFVDGLRQSLAQAMPAAKLDRTSVFPVEGPDPERPITSRVAFGIKGADGRSGEMAIPLFADASGKWLDPPTAEIIASFKFKAAAPAVAAAQPAQPPAPSPPEVPKDLIGADQTHKVDWGDAPKQGQPRPPAPQPASPQPTPQPQSPVPPKKAMPASREVIIDFE